MTKKFIEYVGEIKQSDIGSGGAYIEFPFDVKERFGKTGRIKIKCYFENIEYRGSLVKMGTDCHIIGISKKIRTELKKEIGDSVKIKIIEDNEERILEIPQQMYNILMSNDLYQSFQQLSYTKRKEAIDLFSSAKKAETRENRMTKILKSLK